MGTHLESLFSPALERTPDNCLTEDTHFQFSKRTLPAIEAKIFTDDIYIIRGIHIYNEGNPFTDQLSIHMSKLSCVRLGLLIITSIFQEQHITLNLEHPKSEVRQLHIQGNFDLTFDSELPGFHTRPAFFNYYPEIPQSKHPWYRIYSPENLPFVTLISKGITLDFKNDLRTTAQGFGSPAQSVLLAEHLLNASLTANNIHRFDLEGELGFRGVAPGSAEMVLNIE